MQHNMQRKWVSGVGIIAGLWLFLTPWLLGFITSKPPLVGNDSLGGIAIVAMMAISFFSRIGARRVSWVLILGGIWLMIAGFVYAQGMTSAFWSNVVVGVITAALGVFLTTDAFSSPQVSA